MKKLSTVAKEAISIVEALGRKKRGKPFTTKYYARYAPTYSKVSSSNKSVRSWQKDGDWTIRNYCLNNPRWLVTKDESGIYHTALVG